MQNPDGRLRVEDGPDRTDGPVRTDGPPTIDAPIDTPMQLSGKLVINEVDYDQVGTDSAEFIELYNGSSSAAGLSGVSVMLVNGANNAVYGTVDLSSAGSVPAGQYLVLSGSGVTVATGAIAFPTGWTTDAVQNGSPDGIALVDTTTQTVLDALSYEGSITAAQLTGFAQPVSLVEGTALATSVADSNTVAGSLCRNPNGQDTDDANADWKFCTTSTPGAANM